MKELKEFIDLMDSIEAGKPVVQEVTVRHVDLNHLSDLLDQLEGHLNQAVGIANDLARYGRDVEGPFAGQIRSYLAPHLESWLDDRRQPGSIPNLRKMLVNIDGGADDSSEEDNDNYED